MLILPSKICTWYLQVNSFVEMDSRTLERSKDIVRKAYKFCRKEEKEGISISLKKWLQRTELITGVNKRTVQRVLREGTDNQELVAAITTPLQTRIEIIDGLGWERES